MVTSSIGSGPLPGRASGENGHRICAEGGCNFEPEVTALDGARRADHFRMCGARHSQHHRPLRRPSLTQREAGSPWAGRVAPPGREGRFDRSCKLFLIDHSETFSGEGMEDVLDRLATGIAVVGNARVSDSISASHFTGIAKGLPRR